MNKSTSQAREQRLKDKSRTYLLKAVNSMAMINLIPIRKKYLRITSRVLINHLNFNRSIRKRILIIMNQLRIFPHFHSIMILQISKCAMITKKTSTLLLLINSKINKLYLSMIHKYLLVIQVIVR